MTTHSSTHFPGERRKKLYRVDITDAMCDNMELEKGITTNVSMTDCHCSSGGGHELDRFLRIVLSEESRCNNLQLYRMCHRGMSGAENWRSFGTALATSQQLGFLEMGMMEVPPDGMAPLARLGLAHCKSLQFLSITNTEWDEADDLALAGGLAANESLQNLRLHGCGLKDERLAGIVRALIHHPTLEALGLMGNKFGPETSAALAEVLQCKSNNLKELYLDNGACQHIRGGGQRPKLEIPVLAPALRQNNTIRVLDLSFSLIDDDDLEILARSLMINEEEEEEEFAGSASPSCKDEGVNHNNQCCLESLSLACNKITDVGMAKLLHQWLPRIRCLKNVGLWGNLAEDMTPLNLSPPSHPNVLRNQAICAMIDLQDATLIKAVANPEQIPAGLWPLLLHRLQQIHKHKLEETTTNPFAIETPTTDSVTTELYLTLRGPIVSSMSL